MSAITWIAAIVAIFYLILGKPFAVLLFTIIALVSHRDDIAPSRRSPL